jgi:uncharacterized protein YndB with AHSA1/START domain
MTDPAVLPRVLFALVFAVAGCRAPASVVDITASGFLVSNEVSIHAPPEKVYRALVHQVGRWWNPEHTYSKDSNNLSIDARAGGCFCERLASGGAVEHMSVVYVQPNQTLRMSGALGPLQASGLAGSLTWMLVRSGADTTLKLSYSVGGYMQGGFDKVAPAVDAVLAEQSQRLRRFVEEVEAGR